MRSDTSLDHTLKIPALILCLTTVKHMRCACVLQMEGIVRVEYQGNAEINMPKTDNSKAVG